MSDEVIRELATHASDIRHMQDDMDKMVKDIEEIKKCLHEIQRMLAEEHAQDRTISKMLTIGAGLLGGAIVWLLEKFAK
jgi:signal transduction protein with GAF and PtsI domain